MSPAGQNRGAEAPSAGRSEKNTKRTGDAEIDMASSLPQAHSPLTGTFMRQISTRLRRNTRSSLGSLEGFLEEVIFIE